MDHTPRDKSAKLILASVPVQALLMAGVALLAFGASPSSPAPAQNGFAKPVPAQGPDTCKSAAMWKALGTPMHPGARYELVQGADGASVVKGPGGSVYWVNVAQDGSVCAFISPGHFEPVPVNPDAPAAPAKP
jgi:hypothetical protein